MCLSSAVWLSNKTFANYGIQIFVAKISCSVVIEQDKYGHRWQK